LRNYETRLIDELKRVINDEMKGSAMFMKTNLFIGLMLTVSIGLQAGEKKGPEFTFKKDIHDYGVIYLDDMPETKLEIKFSNTGDEPLILSNVRACCGTRVTQWPREPILPGEEGVINIEFRLAPRPQRISRTVTVTSNDQNNQSHIFRIRGEVKERGQPANSSD
jgi:hypothetical protein